MSDLYPWLISEWQQLFALKQASRLPHALLFSGAEGLGKLEFAKQFVALLLCEASESEPCKQCKKETKGISKEFDELMRLIK